MIAPWFSRPFSLTRVEFVQSLLLALSVSLDESPSLRPEVDGRRAYDQQVRRLETFLTHVVRGVPVGLAVLLTVVLTHHCRRLIEQVGSSEDDPVAVQNHAVDERCG